MATIPLCGPFSGESLPYLGLTDTDIKLAIKAFEAEGTALTFVPASAPAFAYVAQVSCHATTSGRSAVRFFIGSSGVGRCAKPRRGNLYRLVWKSCAELWPMIREYLQAFVRQGHARIPGASRAIRSLSHAL
jgi:hypothetical protein